MIHRKPSLSHPPHCARFGQKMAKAAKSLLLLAGLLLLTGKPFYPAIGATDDTPTGTTAPTESQMHEPKFFPFEEPEKVVYRASWIGIPVAEARIKATPVWEAGKKFYATQVKAKTLPYLDLIFRMRDTIRSVINADTLKPHRFVYQQQENEKTSNTIATYHANTGKWLLEVQKKKRVKHHELDFADTLDPISASYLVRSLDFKVGDEFEFMVFVGGKRRYPMTVKVVREEMIAVGGRVFDAYRMKSRLELPGDDKNPSEFREALVWLSADERRTLLKATSHVLLGDFKIEMVQLESGKPIKIKNLRI